MDRREFLKRTALATVAVGVSDVAKASGLLGPDDTVAVADGKKETENKPLIASAPMLQNYAETSVGVAFAVSSLANGYVTIGERPDLSDGRKVKAGGYRTTDISDRVVQVRITGLKPATTYYYRIGADRIQYKGGYGMKNLGAEDDPRTYSFTTAGGGAPSHFCVINDTHVKWQPFEQSIEMMARLAPACVVWNGDASNTEETIEDQMKIFLTPEIARKDYASQTPYLFSPGNHDFRGMANRHLERVWMYRQPEERDTRDWDLGRNFAVRTGDIALIGLDTGEDKLDTNPKFAGLFNMKAYREAQTQWLRDALQRPEIAQAPFMVAFCHIPLYDTNPKHNPGDVAPADYDPKYNTDFAMWQRTCAQMWGPLLEEAGCQLVITAHQHHYRYDAPSEGRSWAHMVGGGPDMEGKPDRFPTVIEGDVKDGLLHITVHNVRTGQVQQTFTYDRRKLKRRKKNRTRA